MLTVANDGGSTQDGSTLMDEIVRDGARRMLAAALEAEVNAYIAELADQWAQTGRRLVVRKGYHQPRKITTAAGVVEVKAPRVNDKRVDEVTGERERFSSAILPPWCRTSPKISEVLPLLHLHGLSSGDFVPALEQFRGSFAGHSPATVTRLTQQGQADHAAFMDRDLTEVDHVYLWADGIHLNVAWRRPKPASWSSSGCAPTASRNGSRSRTATESPAGSGPVCCATAPAGACAPRCWRSATAP